MMLVRNLPGMTLSRWVDVCCTTPARLMGLTRKGRIQPGCDADLVLWDPQARRTLGPETLHENVDWSPFEGITAYGVPQTVLRRGEVVVDEGRLVTEEGGGVFQARWIGRSEGQED